MTATIPLYKHAEALQILNVWLGEHIDEITALGGALPDELQALLDDADGAFDAKVIDVALFVKSLNHNANAATEEANRLTMRAKAFTRSAEWLEDYLHRCLQDAGKSEVKGALASVTIQRSTPSVTSTLTPDDLLKVHRISQPSWIRYTAESAELNKTEIKAMAKRGEKIPEGVGLVTDNTHVVLR